MVRRRTARRVSRPDRQLTSNRTRGKQLTAVEQGKADVMQAPLPALAAERDQRPATQRRCTSSRPRQTYGIFLNTRLPPFNKLAARQGVQLRDRPQQGRRRLRRNRRSGGGHVSDPAGRDGRLPTLLPVHAATRPARQLDRPRPSPSPQARRSLRNPGTESRLLDWPTSRSSSSSGISPSQRSSGSDIEPR